jgi:phage terminase small subunit
MPTPQKTRCGLCKGRHPSCTGKQDRFVEEYLVDLNATQAAIRAGYSKRTAGCIGFEMLRKPQVACKLGEAAKSRSKRTLINADEVLTALHGIATLDMSTLYGEDGRLLPIHRWPETAKRIVTSLEVDEWQHRDGYTKKVRLPDRIRALELLGRHLKLFTDVLEHTGGLTIQERIARGRRRARKEGDGG